jgi:hypothetical protein
MLPAFSGKAGGGAGKQGVREANEVLREGNAGKILASPGLSQMILRANAADGKAGSARRYLPTNAFGFNPTARSEWRALAAKLFHLFDDEHFDGHVGGNQFKASLP